MIQYRPSSSDVSYDVIVAVISFLFFWGVYLLAWRFLIPSALTNSDRATQADYCTRWCSSVHALISVFGVLICLSTNNWTKESISFGSDKLCRTIFSISIGYFFQDGVILIKHKMQLYEVFIAHHIIASIPYMMNNFFCEHGTFVLASFLLVEVTSLPYNLVTMIEFCGKESTPLYRPAYLVLFVTWIIFRVILPLILLIILFSIVVPEWFYSHNRPDSLLLSSFCILPSTVSAHLITAFCWYVFFGLLIKNFKTVWIKRRRTGSTGERSAIVTDVNDTYDSTEGISHRKEALNDLI